MAALLSSALIVGLGSLQPQGLRGSTQGGSLRTLRSSSTQRAVPPQQQHRLHHHHPCHHHNRPTTAPPPPPQPQQRTCMQKPRLQQLAQCVGGGAAPRATPRHCTHNCPPAWKNPDSSSWRSVHSMPTSTKSTMSRPREAIPSCSTTQDRRSLDPGGRREANPSPTNQGRQAGRRVVGRRPGGRAAAPLAGLVFGHTLSLALASSRRPSGPSV